MNILEIRPYEWNVEIDGELHWRNYHEFYVDGHALVELLDGDGSEERLLEELTGMLGVWPSLASDRLLLSHLAREALDATALQQYLPAGESVDAHVDWLSEALAALASPRVQFYGCALCGSAQCGAVFGEVEVGEGEVRWRLKGRQGELAYCFEERQYMETLAAYWEEAKAGRQLHARR